MYLSILEICKRSEMCHFLAVLAVAHSIFLSLNFEVQPLNNSAENCYNSNKVKRYLKELQKYFVVYFVFLYKNLLFDGQADFYDSYF